MKPSLKPFACLIVTLCAAVAIAPLASAQTTTSPSAYVYVISRAANNVSELLGYSADSTGALTPLPGSPFWTSTSTFDMSLAHTAHWLFASDGTNIYTFSIASNGSLKLTGQVDAASHYSFSGETGANLVLDHTGSTLYGLALDGTGDNEFQFFNKNNTTGSLTYFGSVGPDISYGELNFLGNNNFAYGFGCFQAESHSYGFNRRLDGSLVAINPSVPIPTNSSGEYCLNNSAPDPTNHLAVSMYLDTGNGPQPPASLGVYTADSSGHLSTNSSSQNMVTSEVGWVDNMKISPGGHLLAVGGTSGLQVFFFNGSNPITAYTGFLAVHELSQLAWDTHSHLFGISPSGRLYAFRVTSSSRKQAAGSPYLVSNPRAITVLSK